MVNFKTIDRKDFLKYLWKRVIKPVVIFTVCCFCVQFLVSVFNENGSERFLTIVILSLAILFILADLIGELLIKIKEKIYIKLSEHVKFKLKIIGKISNYLAILILGALLYSFWTKDVFLASIFTILLLIDKVNNISKEEKSKLEE